MNKDEMKTIESVTEDINKQETQSTNNDRLQFNLESVSQATLISYLLS